MKKQDNYLSRFLPTKEDFLEVLKSAYVFLLGVTVAWIILSPFIYYTGIDLGDYLYANMNIGLLMLFAFIGIMILYLLNLYDFKSLILRKILRLFSIAILIVVVVMYIPLFPAMIYFETCHGSINGELLYFSHYNFNGLLVVILVGLNTIIAIIIEIIRIVPWLKKLFSKKITKISQKENWGVYEKSNSGIEWLLGRRQNWHIPREENPDSKPLLEELGFCILGIADEMRYCVGPPEGYKMEKRSEYFHWIYNSQNEIVLWVFEIQELWDFRCYIKKPD